MGFRRLLALALVLALTAACGSSSDDSGGADRPEVPDVTVPASNRSLAVDLLRTMPDGNVVLGPQTIDTVLSMIAAGAKGQTLDELLTVLGHGVPEPDTVLRSHQSDGVTLDLAAKTWIDEAFEPLPAFRQAMTERFGAEARTADFAEHPDDATDAINADVAKTTRGKIPKVLSEPVSNETVLVLVSAAYLLADWKSPFSADNTYPRPFTLADGSKVTPPTMQRVGQYRTAFGDSYRAVELPYKDDRTAMLVIVPDDLNGFASRMDGRTPAEVAGRLADRQVDLTLPKFEVRTKERLDKHIKALGAPSMFDEATVDLSGIAPPKGRLVVDFVQHEAWIKVDEKGTEAAAATAGGVRATSAVIGEDFKVDRPFLYFIRDLPTGTVLFSGRVVNPTG